MTIQTSRAVLLRPSSSATRGFADFDDRPLLLPQLEVKRLEDRLRRLSAGAAGALASLARLAGAHSGRDTTAVAVRAVDLGAQLGLDPDELFELEMSSLLHDIGFLCLPDLLLHRQGPLGPEERRMIQSHPQFGRTLLERIPGFERVGHIVGLHHEQPDGRGYPRALRGDEIPMASRILAVAEGFNAMLSQRSYRDRLPLSEALDRLRAAAGTRYDSRVIELIDRQAARYRRWLRELSERTAEPGERLAPFGPFDSGN